MNVEVLVGLVINVEVERGEVGCCTRGDEHGVGWKESQLFAFKCIVVLFQAGSQVVSSGITIVQTSLRVI